VKYSILIDIKLLDTNSSMAKVKSHTVEKKSHAAKQKSHAAI